MRADIIHLDEVEDYLKFVEAERDLAIRLNIYKHDQELQLKRLESIKNSAIKLKALSRKLGKKPTKEEVVEAIKKYARFC